MIYDKDDFEIKYWGGDFVPHNEDFVSKKPRKKFYKKLLLSLPLFLFLLLIPAIIYGVSKTQINQNNKLTFASQPAVENKKTVNQNTKINETSTSKNIEATETQNVEVIINNDSYWKIAKRVCGNGRLYLSIAAQNNNKALYKGDTVIVNCSI